MIPPWAFFDQHQRAALEVSVAFLQKRLAERATVEWAIGLDPQRTAERMAVLQVLERPAGQNLTEPWASAWRLIEECWTQPALERGPSTRVYVVAQRLKIGERSGSLLAEIVNLVAPRLKVEKHLRLPGGGARPKPRAVRDLFHASLTSGDLVNLQVLQLDKLDDVEFLNAVATALTAAIEHGLGIARRVGMVGESGTWLFGGVYRVYYTAGMDQDPDRHHRGLAPSVKLLHALVSRIAEIDKAVALTFTRHWRISRSGMFRRLWAAMAQKHALATSEEVSDFFAALDNDQFWELHAFPEVAVLRASRFGDLGEKSQVAIAARLCRGPPAKRWRKQLEREKIARYRQYWAARELRRIEVAGWTLPSKAADWLRERLGMFPDLERLTIEEGLPEGVTVQHVPATPDLRYDDLNGLQRLEALEDALADPGQDRDGPAKGANDWLLAEGSAVLVLADLELAGDRANGLSRVWERFAELHSPRAAQPTRNLPDEAGRGLALIGRLSNEAFSSVISAICSWLDSWATHVARMPLGLEIWRRAWPIAVAVTDAEQTGDDTDLSLSGRVIGDEHEPLDTDTLNSPVGKLVGVFLAACPRAGPGLEAFAPGSAPRIMRDIVIETKGRSGFIALHRMTEQLSYFLAADRDWTERHLIPPLLGDNRQTPALWRAIARRTHFTEILRLIGDRMIERATDTRLGRETRQSLVFSLVVEALHAFNEGREPAVVHARVTQMLRLLDDEVRARAAETVQQFVREVSGRDGSGTAPARSAAELFMSAAAPFLGQVWPQERSLATPGVARALADLPTTSGEAFAEAVTLIERFLVPFDGWSMLDYGLYGDEDGDKKLAMIDTEAKASALLRLLELTISSADGAVVPLDLTDALDQIRVAAPCLVESPEFRRLSTLARR